MKMPTMLKMPTMPTMPTLDEILCRVAAGADPGFPGRILRVIPIVHVALIEYIPPNRQSYFRLYAKSGADVVDTGIERRQLSAALVEAAAYARRISIGNSDHELPAARATTEAACRVLQIENF